MCGAVLRIHEYLQWLSSSILSDVMVEQSFLRQNFRLIYLQYNNHNEKVLFSVACHKSELFHYNQQLTTDFHSVSEAVDTTCIVVDEASFLGRKRCFARISLNFPEKCLCDKLSLHKFSVYVLCWLLINYYKRKHEVITNSLLIFAYIHLYI